MTQRTASPRPVKWFALGALCLLAHGHLLSQTAKQHGTVEGNTYSDQRFGLHYTFPAKLEVQTSVGDIPVGTGEKAGTSEFLLSAMEKPTGRIRSGVLITSDPIGTAGIHETQLFLNLAITRVLAPKNHPEISKTTIAGRTFYESRVGGNASVPGGTIPFYGAQVATDCSGHFLVFCFSGASSAEIDELLHSLDRMQMTCPVSSK